MPETPSLQQNQSANLEALIQQVEILTESVKSIIDRNDQFLKIYQDQTLKMNELMDHTMILNEALTKSLSDSDSQIDDLAQIIAGGLTIVKQIQQQQEELEEEGG